MHRKQKLSKVQGAGGSNDLLVRKSAGAREKGVWGLEEGRHRTGDDWREPKAGASPGPQGHRKCLLLAFSL